MNDFAGRLKALMVERQLTQTAVARAAGVSQPTIVDALRGSDVRLSTYRKLLAAFPELDEAVAS